jgi:phosphoglycerate kinase
MKFLSDFNLNGKKVLLRADINSDVKNRRVLMSERIKETAETIKLLKKKKAKIVILAHQGQEGKSDFAGLEQHAKLLSKFTKVFFVKDIIGEKAKNAIKNLKNGEALLLENVRFEGDEFKPEKGRENKLIKNLAHFFDLYINDAFSVCHRKHTSVVGFPRYIKSCAGPLLEKEIKSVKKIKMKNSLYILGGAKPEDYLPLLKGRKVLACGLFGQSCLAAQGFDFGFQNKYLEKEASLDAALKKELGKKLKNVVTPIDFAVKVNGKRKELSLNAFPNNYEIFDIGKKTQEIYKKEIEQARGIYMKGPAGDCDSKGFAKGTFELLKAVSKVKGFSLIGGGHLSGAIKASKIPLKKFSYVSLSGGALLKYIAGEKLPGLEALK